MAASDVQICKRALQILGAATITALDQDTSNAREMNIAYASVRDAEFNRRRWRFTFKRASLPALAAAPMFDYARAFELPDDFIRLVEGGDIATLADSTDYLGGFGLQYSIEGRTILSNLSAPLKIRYIARITDTTLFTPAFDEAFAARLAEATCERITQSTTKVQDCKDTYRTAIREAVKAQALELPSEALADDTWVNARTR